MNTILLNGNYNNLDRIETTLKSIFFHNQHIEVHLINSDIPHEWFINLNRYINQFGGLLIDEKIDPQILSKKSEFEQISKFAFPCFLSLSLIDADQTLYLDSDLIVVDNLQEIFGENFVNKAIYAGRDYQNPENFDSGVIVINNKRLKDEKIDQKLSNLNEESLKKEVSDFFKNNVEELNLAFNYQIGCERDAYWNNKQSAFDYLNKVTVPKIFNYTTKDKPFNIVSTGSFRDKWWEYHNLVWSDIVSNHVTFDRDKLEKQKFAAETFIFAGVADTKNIEELIKKLPNIRFNIVSYTDMAWMLKRLIKYDNVRLRPFIMDKTLDSLIDKADFFLDINYLKDNNVTQKIIDKNKPIYSFEETKNNNISCDQYYIFNNDDLSGMIKVINDLLNKKANNSFNIKVKDIDESLDLILNQGKSVIRFGDGEFNIIRGESIFYQDYNKELAMRLESIILSGNYDNTLICLPDVFEGLDRYNTYAQRTYLERFFPQNREFLKTIEKTENWYGSTFVSRPYIDLVDKSESAGYFEKLKRIWNRRDVLIVEGKYSRSGIGNDLFDNAKTVERIICPSKNSYDKLRPIEDAIRRYAGDKLILLMLGPTAKVIVDDLHYLNNQIIDIGHIDSEYEWFKMGARDKVKLKNKHTAEFNQDTSIEPIKDKKYTSQIIYRIE